MSKPSLHQPQRRQAAVGGRPQRGSALFMGDHLARSVRGLPGAPPQA